MQSFDQSLMKLLRDELITDDEALKYCTNPNEFQLHLKGINSSSDRTWAPVEAGQLKNATRASNYGPQGGEAVDVPARPLGTAASRGGLPGWMSKD
jgi:twitching motility protein PilT